MEESLYGTPNNTSKEDTRSPNISKRRLHLKKREKSVIIFNSALNDEKMEKQGEVEKGLKNDVLVPSGNLITITCRSMPFGDIDNAMATVIIPEAEKVPAATREQSSEAKMRAYAKRNVLVDVNVYSKDMYLLEERETVDLSTSESCSINCVPREVVFADSCRSGNVTHLKQEERVPLPSGFPIFIIVFGTMAFRLFTKGSPTENLKPILNPVTIETDPSSNAWACGVINHTEEDGIEFDEFSVHEPYQVELGGVPVCVINASAMADAEHLPTLYRTIRLQRIEQGSPLSYRQIHVINPPYQIDFTKLSAVYRPAYDVWCFQLNMVTAKYLKSNAKMRTHRRISEDFASTLGGAPVDSMTHLFALNRICRCADSMCPHHSGGEICGIDVDAAKANPSTSITIGIDVMECGHVVCSNCVRTSFISSDESNDPSAPSNREVYICKVFDTKKNGPCGCVLNIVDANKGSIETTRTMRFTSLDVSPGRSHNSCSDPLLSWSPDDNSMDSMGLQMPVACISEESKKEFIVKVNAIHGDHRSNTEEFLYRPLLTTKTTKKKRRYSTKKTTQERPSVPLSPRTKRIIIVDPLISAKPQKRKRESTSTDKGNAKQRKQRNPLRDIEFWEAGGVNEEDNLDWFNRINGW